MDRSLKHDLDGAYFIRLPGGESKATRFESSDKEDRKPSRKFKDKDIYNLIETVWAPGQKPMPKVIATGSKSELDKKARSLNETVGSRTLGKTESSVNQAKVWTAYTVQKA